MFTAHGTTHDREGALAAGFQAYVTKAVDPLALLDAVASLARVR